LLGRQATSCDKKLTKSDRRSPVLRVPEEYNHSKAGDRCQNDERRILEKILVGRRRRAFISREHQVDYARM